LHPNESHVQITLYRKTLFKEWKEENPTGKKADFARYTKGLEEAGTIDVRGRAFPGISNVIADLAPESKKGPCTSLHHFQPESVVLLTFPTGTPPRTWIGDGRRDDRRTAAVDMC
jgi:hypothetical protein